MCVCMYVYLCVVFRARDRKRVYLLNSLVFERFGC